MAMNDIHSTLDEPVGKLDLLVGYLVPPVGAPVDRCDGYVAGLFGMVEPACHALGGLFGKFAQQVDAWPVLGGAPLRGDAAGRRAEREDEHVPLGRHFE